MDSNENKPIKLFDDDPIDDTPTITDPNADYNSPEEVVADIRSDEQENTEPDTPLSPEENVTKRKYRKSTKISADSINSRSVPTQKMPICSYRRSMILFLKPNPTS